MSSRPDAASAAQLYAVLQEVRPLHRFAAQVVADRLVGTGITVASRAIMERLLLDGPQPVPHVAHALALPRQAVQRHVNELIALGLATTRPNPLHQRSHLIALTPEGTARLVALRAHEDATLAGVGEQVSADDAEAAVRVMAALTARFRRMTEEARAAGRAAADQTEAVDRDALAPSTHPTEGAP